MISVITSCSARGWEEYGRRFVETFLKHWPATVDLHFVSEDNIGPLVASKAVRPVTFHHLGTVSQAAQEFHERHAKDARARGRGPSRRAKEGYDFRLDAYKFAKKVFAIEAVAEMLDTGAFFWVDADVVTHDDVPIDLLYSLLPDEHALSCLARGAYHSECGFVGYNLFHPASLPFIRSFAKLYASDEVFQLQEWHDSWVFDWLRRRDDVPTYEIPHNSRSHPFVNSCLGRYMDHLKGARKDKGRTPLHQVVTPHKAAYWGR